MARKLKTYVTSIGFFDLAVAAPSMKAASDAWGSGQNLFKWGFAKETDDPAVVAATLAKPGIVLKRPVGTKGAFKENAALPEVLTADHGAARERRSGKRTALEHPPRKPRGDAARKAADDAARKAAAAFAAEHQRRERQRRIDEAAQEKEHRRRVQAVARGEAALEKARAHHDRVITQITSRRDSLDRQIVAENARWENEREQLAAALNRARK